MPQSYVIEVGKSVEKLCSKFREDTQGGAWIQCRIMDSLVKNVVNGSSEE